MRITVDTATDSPEQVLLIIGALIALFDLAEAMAEMKQEDVPPGTRSNVLPFPQQAPPAFVVPPPPAVVVPPVPLGTPAAEAATIIQNAGLHPVNCDTHGTPWDPKLHSTPAKLNSDGTWRARRGLAKNPSVAGPAITVTAAASSTPSPTSAPASASAEPDPATAGFGQVPPVVPPTPPVTLQQPVPQSPPAGGTPPILSGPIAFPDLMTLVNQSVSAGRITRDAVQEVLKASGVTGGFAELTKRADILPAVHAALLARLQ